MIKNTVFLVILLVIAYFYTRPFYQPGYFATHDGEWAIVRLAEMQREVKDLQLPPRWADYLNHGYGYPLFNFAYPFPYYLGLIFTVSGIGLTGSIKALFVLSVVLSAVFMFFLGKSLVNRYAGFIAAVFYVTAPFRMVDLYVRGSVGESLALALFPLLFYLGLKYIVKPGAVSGGLVSLVLAILILTHNATALLFFPVWVLYLITLVISYSEDVIYYSWRYLLPVILLGVMLSAYFLLPAFVEKSLLVLSRVRLADLEANFVRIPEFLVSAWNFGSRPSFQLGLPQLAGVLISLPVIMIFAGPIKRKKHFPLVIFSLFMIIILIFMMTGLSSVLWRLPPLSWLDFPWRLMTPLIFVLSLSAIFLPVTKISGILGIVLALMAAVFNFPQAKAIDYFQKPDAYYSSNDATTTSMDEFMPEWVIDKPKNRYPSKVELVAGSGSISDLNYNSKTAGFNLITSSDATVVINTIYYPGWRLRVNQEYRPIDYSNPLGVIQFSLPAGNYQVKADFKETPLRLTADLISVAGLAVISTMFFLGIKKRFISEE